MENRLSAFQREVLDAFCRREPEFFLTGGGALAGYHLGHRTTEDLDLFVTSELLNSGASSLAQVATELRASLESLRTAPHFRRYLLRRGDEGVLVDLVFDPTPRGETGPELHGSVRVDPPQEILANKLCALLSRSELRDLVDLRALEATGLCIEEALPLAMEKDSGLTPGQLAWVLSRFHVDGGASIPGRSSVAQLREYLRELVKRLASLAYP